MRDLKLPISRERSHTYKIFYNPHDEDYYIGYKGHVSTDINYTFIIVANIIGIDTTTLINLKDKICPNSKNCKFFNCVDIQTWCFYILAKCCCKYEISLDKTLDWKENLWLKDFVIKDYKAQSNDGIYTNLKYLKKKGLFIDTPIKGFPNENNIVMEDKKDKELKEYTLNYFPLRGKVLCSKEEIDYIINYIKEYKAPNTSVSIVPNNSPKKDVGLVWENISNTFSVYIISIPIYWTNYPEYEKGSILDYIGKFTGKYFKQSKLPKPFKNGEFKRGDYIVITGSVNSELVFTNFCYKIRDNNPTFMYVEKDASGASNAIYIKYEEVSRWRYATEEEMCVYEVLEAPFNVETFRIDNINIVDYDIKLIEKNSLKPPEGVIEITKKDFKEYDKYSSIKTLRPKAIENIERKHFYKSLKN